MTTRIYCPKEKKIQNNLKWLVSLGISLKWEKTITHKCVTAIFPPKNIRITTRFAEGDRFLYEADIEAVKGAYIQSIPGHPLSKELLILLSEDIEEIELVAIHLDHNKKTGTIRSIEVRELQQPLHSPRSGVLRRLVENDDCADPFSK